MSTDLTPIESTPVSLIREAMANKADPAYLREMLAVRRDWEADEARKAYNVAISEFQRRAPIIAKEDKAYDKTYARMDRIWREIRPLLTELGLSVTWQVCELKDEICHVEGQLRHRDGFGEKLVQDIPVPELIKGQNKAQQMGSASTYARRYALCAALGIVTGEDNDANFLIDPDEAREIDDLLDACRGIDSFNEAKFWEWLARDGSVKQSADIPVTRLADVLAMLNRKLGRMKK